MAAIRYLDVEPHEDLENESPLHGVNEAEDLTAEQACAKAKAACPALATWDLNLALAAAARAVRRLEKKGELEPLSCDEAFSVHIYTQDSWFYKEVNRLLRLRDRAKLKPFFPYLKLILTGLHRLKPIDDTVFRGVRLDLSGKYADGDDIIWWAFSSATATAAVLSTDEFLGSSGPRTLFSIKVHRAVDVRKYSAIGSEDERLILPGTPFTVKPHLKLGGGLTMIQIEEDRSCPSMISGFSFSAAQNADQVTRLWHGTTTSALPGIIAARSLQPSVAGFYGPGVYLTSSRTKAVAWARFRAATAGRHFVASDGPQGKVHVIGSPVGGSCVDELGARPVLVAVDVRLGKCKTFDAVLRDADYFYWSLERFHRDPYLYIPALRERAASLRGKGPYLPSPHHGEVLWRGENRVPPEFEVLVSDEMGRLTMQQGPASSSDDDRWPGGSAWFRRANGVDDWMREGFDSQYIPEGLPSGSGALSIYSDTGGRGNECLDGLGPVHDRFRGDEYVVRDGSRVAYVSHEDCR
jgi:hypothetical protein